MDTTLQMLPRFSMMDMIASRNLGESTPTGKPETGLDMSRILLVQSGPVISVALVILSYFQKALIA